MAESGIVLGLVGSPNRNGRSNQMVSAALEGAAAAGASVEIVQMADHRVDACKDCLPWVCQNNLKCSYEDPAFEYLSDKIRNCSALVLGAPVYWSDTSGMVRCLILKMFRCFARNGVLNGLPALGIGIAGGTGNGLVAGLRPLYHFFQMMQMRAIEPLPVTRFDMAPAERRARELGALLAEQAREPRPFDDVEDRMLWYDTLPYLSMSRAEERRLLASVVVNAVAGKAGPSMAVRLATAGMLAGRGNDLEAMKEVTAAYMEAVKLFDGK